MSILMRDRKPCPICGKPDWCGRKEFFDSTIYYCARWTQFFSSLEKNDFVTINGQEFVFIGESQSNYYGRFEPREDWERYRSQYRSQWKKSSGRRKIEVPNPKQHRSEYSVTNIADTEKIDTVYKKMLSLLVLEEKHLQNLKQEGWNDSLIKMKDYYLIRSLPPADTERYHGNEFLHNRFRKTIMQELTKEFPDLTGIPGFYKKPDGSWTLSGLEGMLFPIWTPDRKILRLRIRIDDAARKKVATYQFQKLSKEEQEKLLREKGTEERVIQNLMNHIGKYHNFASTGKVGGTESGSYPGVWTEKPFFQNNEKRAFIGEGEKKGIVASHFLKGIFISLPGVNSFKKMSEPLNGLQKPLFEYLREVGVERIAVMNDSDMLHNQTVLEMTLRLLKLIHEEGFIPEIGSWDESFGKGIDDALLAGVWPRFQKIKII